METNTLLKRMRCNERDHQERFGIGIRACGYQ